MTSDPIRTLLLRLTALDPPESLLVACRHAELPALPAAVLGVRLAGCVTDETLSLPAQLLLAGPARVSVLLCDRDPERAAAQVAAWTSVLPDVVAVDEPPRRRFGRAGGAIFDLALRSVPRRVALGLPPSRHLALDLDSDSEARGVVALRLLAEQGRARLPDPSVEQHRKHPGEPVSAILIAEGCTACGVCVRACPNEALTLTAGDGESVLEHHAESCRSDGACVRLCPVQALTSTGALDLIQLARRPVTELARLATVACPRCGSWHPTGEGALCRPCAFRTEQAFGSYLH